MGQVDWFINNSRVSLFGHQYIKLQEAFVLHLWIINFQSAGIFLRFQETCAYCAGIYIVEFYRINLFKCRFVCDFSEYLLVIVDSLDGHYLKKGRLLFLPNILQNILSYSCYYY